MAIVSSTEGSPTNTFWKRRSSAASFSTYLRYSSSVVAPMQCSSPRASAGLSMLPASIAPSALPAPTIVCSSSMKRITWPSFLARSLSTAFNRSSNSPRNFAPAISAPMSSDSTRLPRKPSGTSPLTMRCARPSTIAVLPTPGSPISAGLFLVRRCSTCTVRRISSSRPMTGCSLPPSARAGRAMVYWSSAWRWSSAFSDCTVSPPRTFSIAASSFCFVAPAAFNARPTSPLSSSAASTNSSVAMKASPRCCAYLSVTLSRRARSLPTLTLPAWPVTLGSFSSVSPRRSRSSGTLTPACDSNGRVLPPLCSSSAVSRCTGSMTLWSRPTASDWASLRACWKREVSFSIRMAENLGVGLAAGPGRSGKCGLALLFQAPMVDCGSPGHALGAYIPPFTMRCMTVPSGSLPSPPLPAREWALFLDVDGTLLDLAPAPDQVRIPETLVSDLRILHEALDGALALISGRRIETLDAFFHPLQLPAIGLHGLQRRAAEGGHPAPDALPVVLAAACDLARKYPGSLVEDKGITIALHWRNAPAAEEPFHEFANSALIELPGYCLQPGHDVLELRPDGHDKGSAIASLLETQAFRGRVPVFVGDDLTDEFGFDVVNARHGISVLVGGRSGSAATRSLHGPQAVRDWLHEAATRLANEAVA